MLAAALTTLRVTECLAESAAFQGHAAEMQQRDEAQESRRRALYFDTVDVEIGPQGLPCDHVGARKPEAIAGPGFVVLAIVDGARTMTSRIWLPPGAFLGADATRSAEAALAARFPNMTFRITDIERFLWCR